MNAYIASVLKAIGGDANLTPSAIQRTTVNGIAASYTPVCANSQSGQVDVTVFAYEFARNSAFHFVALTKAGGAGSFNSMFGSLRRLRESEAAAIRTRRVDVVTVRSGDEVASHARHSDHTSNKVTR